PGGGRLLPAGPQPASSFRPHRGRAGSGGRSAGRRAAMKIAVIPARGGSRRIPGKNIRAFAGKPIIAYSIESAVDSALFDRIIVSTDDPRIAAVAVALGAEAPFLRPATLADDHTGTNAVVKHAVAWAIAQGCAVTHACCIYATAPFIQANTLREG